jgi:murein hydrolase activator
MRRLFVVSILICFLAMGNSFAQNREDLERKRNITLKEIAETENILNAVKQNKTESIDLLNLLDKKISLRNGLINNLSVEINEVDKKIIELERITQSLGSDIKIIKEEYARMIYLAYLNREPYNKFMYILSARDLGQAYKRIKYLQQYSEYHKRQVEVIKGVQNSLDKQITELDEKRKEKLMLLNSQERESNLLKNEVDEKTELIKLLKLKENQLNNKIKEQTRIAEKLQKEIENIIKAEIKAKADAEKNSKQLSQRDVILSNNFRENKGKLPWPTDGGVITRGFGEYQHPIYKSMKLQSLGIEITTASGSNVKAIFDGEVASIIDLLGTNNTILITHGNFFTVYQNVVNVRVKKGDKIKTNQIIGNVFAENNSKTSILRVQIWDGKNKLDPEVWLNRN